MTTERTEKKRTGITWQNPYAKKGSEELQVFTDQIIDGYIWRVAPDGHSYCAGPVAEVNNDTSDISPDPPQSQRPSVANPVTPRNPRESTIPTNKAAENVTDEMIIELSEKGLSTRAIGRQVGKSHMTVARKLKGQGTLL